MMRALRELLGEMDAQQRRLGDLVLHRGVVRHELHRIGHAATSSSKHSMSERCPVVSARQRMRTRAPGCARSARTAVERVQQRRVGAVELHQRPRERAVHRVRAQRLGHPGCVHDYSRRRDLDHLADRFAGLGVVLERRHQHPPARGAHADHPALAEAGEERTDHGADAAPVGKLELPSGRHGGSPTARHRARARSAGRSPVTPSAPR